MASAMRKMAVYLGLVEDDHRYDDQYQDEYGAEEYEEYGAEFIDQDDSRDVVSRVEGDGIDRAGRLPERQEPAIQMQASLWSRCRPPIWPGSPHCIRARTMRPVRSESTSARALR